MLWAAQLTVNRHAHGSRRAAGKPDLVATLSTRRGCREGGAVGRTAMRNAYGRTQPTILILQSLGGFVGGRVGPVVRVEGGLLRGRELGGVCVFLGVPYAAAPIGANRFRPAAPVTGWDGVRDAVRFGATVPRPGYPAPFDRLFVDPVIAGENYLNLNIWTLQPDGSGLPVMVWIHGGAFLHGSAAMPLYDGTAFARNGIMLVTVNYRLGALGFGLFPDSPANLGLHDQLAALRWVQQNITAFGGDPSQVTIFGQSSGGASVAALLSSPAGRGLFGRAIVQSAGATPLLTAADARLVTADLAARLDVAPRAAAFSDIDTVTLLAAQQALINDLTRDPDAARWGRSVVASGMAFGTVLDGQLLTAAPKEAIAAGAGRDIPLLVGSTLDEHRLFLVPTGHADATTVEALSAAVDHAGWDQRIVDTYAANRLGASPGDLWAAICTDAYFRLPAVRLAEAHQKGGGTSYLYEFAWRSPTDRLGACHAVELPFVFDTTAHPAAQPLLGTNPPQQLATAMHAAWLQFARHGHPDWPDYNPTTRPVVSFNHPACELVNDPRGDERALWDGII
jgi:para-nitrobenzyl esterase